MLPDLNGYQVCEQIRRQKIKAVFSIEYEYNWGKAVPELAQCVAYFDKVAADLLAMNVTTHSHKAGLLRRKK